VIAEVVNIFIDGVQQDELVPDVIEIEAEEHVSSADVFRLRLALHPRPDGSWTCLDDDRFRVWRRLTLRAGYPGQVGTVFDGYITHAHVACGHGREPYLEVSGLDVTAIMDLEEKQLAWANKRDDEIARAIFTAYGLSADVEITVTRHVERTSTIMQAETDIRFLRRLARRNGFECFVQGATGVFRSPDMRQPPQPPLAVEFGGETNVSDIRISVDGTPVTAPEIRRLDPLAKRVEIRRLTASPRRQLGARSLGALRSTFPEGRAFLRGQSPADAVEMNGRLRQAYQPATEFVSAEGEIDSRLYRNVLRAKRLVTIKGLGRTFSGLYYVTRVRHSFTVDGYTQRFEAYRNGLGLLGIENFEKAALEEALLGAAGHAARGAGNRILPVLQTTSPQAERS
jgi:Phage tail baseplate hub (GPD)